MNPWLGLGAGNDIERARLALVVAGAQSTARQNIMAQKVVRVPAPKAPRPAKAKPAVKKTRRTHAKALIQAGLPLAQIPYGIGPGLLFILALMNDGEQWTSRDLQTFGVKKGSMAFALRTLVQADAIEAVSQEDRRPGVHARAVLYRITPAWQGDLEHQVTLALEHNENASEKREAVCG